MTYKESLRLKRAKHIILSENYSINRADEMNNKIQGWKMKLKKANTATEKKLCINMVWMYMKRYLYYVSKGLL